MFDLRLDVTDQATLQGLWPAVSHDAYGAYRRGLDGIVPPGLLCASPPVRKTGRTNRRTPLCLKLWRAGRSLYCWSGLSPGGNSGLCGSAKEQRADGDHVANRNRKRHQRYSIRRSYRIGSPTRGTGEVFHFVKRRTMAHITSKRPNAGGRSRCSNSGPVGLCRHQAEHFRGSPPFRKAVMGQRRASVSCLALDAECRQ